MASSRPPLRRLAALVYGRVRANQRLRLLSSTAERASPSPSPAEPEAVRMTEGCVRRLKELHAKEPSADAKMLRVSVEAGGCSGFQYNFSLDNKKASDDRIFEKDGVKLIVDDISYDFVKGATVDYEEELIRSAFVVSTNPSAVWGLQLQEFFHGQIVSTLFAWRNTEIVILLPCSCLSKSRFFISMGCGNSGHWSVNVLNPDKSSPYVDHLIAVVGN